MRSMRGVSSPKEQRAGRHTAMRPPGLGEASRPARRCACQKAKQACLPFLVWGVGAQEDFQGALAHFGICEEAGCRAVREKVRVAMGVKIQWLMKRGVHIGCDEAQSLQDPQPGRSLPPEVFFPVTSHLARCPRDSCVRLRHALLLTIRKFFGADRYYAGKRSAHRPNIFSPLTERGDT